MAQSRVPIYLTGIQLLKESLIPLVIVPTWHFCCRYSSSSYQLLLEFVEGQCLLMSAFADYLFDWDF